MFVIVDPENSSQRPEHCDFCSEKRGVNGRYLFHNNTHTESICNYCILLLAEQVAQIDFLRDSPHGPAQ